MKDKNINSENKKDLRKELTDKIISELEKGVVPWEKPWDGAQSFNRPINASTGKGYQGGNALHLLFESQKKGYNDPRWCTYIQASENGWQVKKGEKATLIEFWKFHDEKIIKDSTGKPLCDDSGKQKKELIERKAPIVLHYYVFNAKQIDGVPLFQNQNKFAFEKVEKAEEILRKSGAKICHDQADRAYYSSANDEIHLPDKVTFLDKESYYSTALHELGHWTGHQSRLNRDLKHSFGTEGYAKEELRAEIASAFLSFETGIDPNIGQHASYIKSWIKILKEDKNEIFRAARDAELISNYVMDFSKNVEKNKAEIKENELEKRGNKKICYDTVNLQKDSKGIEIDI